MVKEIDQNKFESEILQASGFCVVDFFATWCPPCKMLSPEIEKVSEMYEDVSFFKVNTDENMDLSMQYKISVVPTIIFFKQGKIIDQEEGYKSKEELKKIIDSMK